MKTFKYFFLFFCLLLIGAATHAQQGSFKATINYTVGIPTGNFRNITDKVSTRGWDASLLYGVTDKILVGLETGLQDFYQRFPRQVIHSNGSDLSAVITQSIQVTPIMVKGKYTFSDIKIVEPYVAVAAGANLVNYRTYYGEFSDSHSAAKFAAQPEVGVFVPFTASKRVGLNLSAGYNIMPFQYGQADGLNNVVVKGGISFTLK